MDSDSDPRDWEDYEDFDDFLVDEVSGMMSAGSDISSISTDIDIILADDGNIFLNKNLFIVKIKNHKQVYQIISLFYIAYYNFYSTLITYKFWYF